jgi:hypothetical protein
MSICLSYRHFAFEGKGEIPKSELAAFRRLSGQLTKNLRRLSQSPLRPEEEGEEDGQLKPATGAAPARPEFTFLTPAPQERETS